MNDHDSPWAIIVGLIAAAILVGMMALACAQDTQYYREHGVWWGTPPATTEGK